MEDTRNTQKIKLLVISDLLTQESDEQHPWTTRMICSYLEGKGISCDRRTLSKDMEVLNSYGYEIMDCPVGKEKGYYVEDRSFSGPEIKILLDAVQAASFITPRKTKELTDKISALSGTNRAEILKSNMTVFNTRKHSNEEIYYIVDYLERALRKKKKVSFYYFDLDEKGNKIFRKERKRYVTDPMHLVFIEDNYYLMCWTEKYGSITNYRIDRMEEVSIEDEPVSEEAMSHIANMSTAKYTEQVFKMYGGPTEDVTLVFDRSLIGAVYDKFGEKIKIRKTDDDRFFIIVPVQVSPPFFGWVFQFSGKMRIASPDKVKMNYLSYIKAGFDAEK